MTIKSIQGDMFEVGISGDYQFILIFGHMGFNELGAHWNNFKDGNRNFKNIGNPFDTLRAPTKFDEKWIQFIAAQENHGMEDSTLEQKFRETFEWMEVHGLKKIITNGIMDTNHSTNTIENQENDDTRVKFIETICSQHPKLDITLISLNKVYLRNE